MRVGTKHIVEKSTSASQWLNYDTRLFGQWLGSSDTADQYL